jgi:hypothetical protein
MQKLRIVMFRVWPGATEKWPLNEGQITKFRVVYVSTGYNRVEGNRRAPRNGRVSSSPTRNP